MEGPVEAAVEALPDEPVAAASFAASASCAAAAGDLAIAEGAAAREKKFVHGSGSREGGTAEGELPKLTRLARLLASGRRMSLGERRLESMAAYRRQQKCG